MKCGWKKMSDMRVEAPSKLEQVSVLYVERCDVCKMNLYIYKRCVCVCKAWDGENWNENFDSLWIQTGK